MQAVGRNRLCVPGVVLVPVVSGRIPIRFPQTPSSQVLVGIKKKNSYFLKEKNILLRKNLQ